MNTKELIEALEAWAPMVASGYEVPAAGQVMLEAARRLALADRHTNCLMNGINDRRKLDNRKQTDRQTSARDL